MKPFIRHYFEEVKSKTNKATINQINFNPDKIYLATNGYTGNCWTAIVSEMDGLIHYNFRNFRDLVNYYEKKGFTFV
jgi:hypothetical protein